MLDSTLHTALSSELVDNEIALEWARCAKDWPMWFDLLLERANIQNKIDTLDNAPLTTPAA